MHASGISRSVNFHVPRFNRPESTLWQCAFSQEIDYLKAGSLPLSGKPKASKVSHLKPLFGQAIVRPEL